MHIINGEKGLSMVEIIVATTILSLVLVGAGLMFATTRNQIFETGNDRSALTCAVQKIEELKALPYQDADLVSSLKGTAHPPWSDPLETITTDDRGTPTDGADDIKACLRWIVTDVDDNANGTGSPDYKLVRVEIYHYREACTDIGEESLIIFLESIVSP